MVLKSLVRGFTSRYEMWEKIPPSPKRLPVQVGIRVVENPGPTWRDSRSVSSPSGCGRGWVVGLGRKWWRWRKLERNGHVWFLCLQQVSIRCPAGDTGVTRA